MQIAKSVRDIANPISYHFGHYYYEYGVYFRSLRSTDYSKYEYYSCMTVLHTARSCVPAGEAEQRRWRDLWRRITSITISPL